MCVCVCVCASACYCVSECVHARERERRITSRREGEGPQIFKILSQFPQSAFDVGRVGEGERESGENLAKHIGGEGVKLRVDTCGT